ncbi:ABC transporter permease subunit [Pimelobacter simplex]|uniref:ABC transporter permease subunit n=1 Tax=Nocardioides simplex TaxID=2045 RepID=A0A7J5DT53_NOCSI|nr:ABC transporter permease subunit [Pimelobacter simplex]
MALRRQPARPGLRDRAGAAPRAADRDGRDLGLRPAALGDRQRPALGAAARRPDERHRHHPGRLPAGTRHRGRGGRRPRRRAGRLRAGVPDLPDPHRVPPAAAVGGADPLLDPAPRRRHHHDRRQIVFASFWPILFNTYYGVRAVNPVAIESARIFGLNRRQVFFRVQIPSAAVNIAAGIRVSSAIALILVITVEILTRSGGLGYYIVRMQVAIRTEDMYAGIFVVGVIGYVVALAVAGLERRIIFWNSDIREGGDR